MRVSLSEYEGHPYISLRLWEQGQDGAWWPKRQGCSVRIAEAAELAEVLARVAGVRPGSERESQPRLPRRGPTAPRGPAIGAASRTGPADGFDEFNGDDAG